MILIKKEAVCRVCGVVLNNMPIALQFPAIKNEVTWNNYEETIFTAKSAWHCPCCGKYNEDTISAVLSTDDYVNLCATHFKNVFSTMEVRFERTN
jgi:hypothetical protein